ncbi:GntR family transcriptional regulator [Anaerostipes faecalis]|uniref:GntR family transcriptional regulator n=1 Tax=Anaerostipes faecalis TaxID=2738446 RepID=UPI001C1DF262|nr:GntR family transcriptional regulator [Anaerostipes faecalis]
MEKISGEMKYYSIKESLKNDILSGVYQPGEKMPSEYQLVDFFGVSRHTIRKALSILEDEGYIIAKHGKGTFCTERVIHKKESMNIAVVTTYISDYIFPRLIQGINQVLARHGYSLIFKTTGNSRRGETACLEDVLTKDIDGMIIEPSKSEIICRHPKLFETFDSYEIPYVFIHGVYAEMKDKPHILMNDCKGGYLLTAYLIQLGHKHIAGVFKADDYQGKERHKGYVKALQEAGYAYDPDMVVWFHTEDREIKPANMILQMKQSGKEMDAVVCYNDQIALSVMMKLQKNGISVPQNISITGYDNSFLAQFNSIPLTTIAHPQEKLGEMAGQLLLEKIKGIPEEQSAIPRLIEPELIIGKSCMRR